MHQDTATDPRGRYLTLSEFSAKHPEYTVRTLHNFIAHGMPNDPRGGLYFVYEQQALDWIAQNVEQRTTYVVKSA